MIPETIRSRMKELGLSITRLADKSGLSESSIKRALSGASLAPSTAQLLAKALELQSDPLSPPAAEPAEPVSEPDPPEEMTLPDDPSDLDELITEPIEPEEEKLCSLSWMPSSASISSVLKI